MNNNIQLREAFKSKINSKDIKDFCDFEIVLFELEASYHLTMPVLYQYLTSNFYNWHEMLLEEQVKFQVKRVEMLEKIYHLLKSTSLKDHVELENVSEWSVTNMDFKKATLKYNRNVINAYNRLNKLQQELDDVIG
jgi:hypothetical protein